MKRILVSSTILMIGLIFPYESTEATETAILERHWAYENVENMVNEGIYSSSIISLNQFDAPITRAEATSFFAKFYGEKSSDVTVLAKDITVTDTHYNSIKLLIQHGVLHNNETFNCIVICICNRDVFCQYSYIAVSILDKFRKV